MPAISSLVPPPLNPYHSYIHLLSLLLSDCTTLLLTRVFPCTSSSTSSSTSTSPCCVQACFNIREVLQWLVVDARETCGPWHPSHRVPWGILLDLLRGFVLEEHGERDDEDGDVITPSYVAVCHCPCMGAHYNPTSRLSSPLLTTVTTGIYFNAPSRSTNSEWWIRRFVQPVRSI
jgi:hypothetical protein